MRTAASPTPTRPRPRRSRAGTDELLGRSVHELLTPTASRRELQEIARGHHRGPHLDGRAHRPAPATAPTFPHRVTLAPRYDEDGTIVGTVGVGRDITPEVAASARARASDERFRRVFDESPVAMGLVGTDLRIQRSNAAMERLLGYTNVELAGQTLEAVTHPDDVQEDLDGAQRLLDRRGPQRTRSRSGSSARTARSSSAGSPARSSATTTAMPMYGIGTVEDLTATLGAFAAIQEQKERLALTLEAAGVATWDLDLVTMRQTVSDNYADVLGIPFDEVPDTFDEIIAMVHPDDQHLFLEPNPDEGAADRFDVEFRMVRRPRAASTWIGCKGSFVRDDDGELIAIRGTMVNLTDQRDVEIRRVEAEERYRQTIEAANDAFVGVDADGRVVRVERRRRPHVRLDGRRRSVGRSVMETLVPEDRRERYGDGLAEWEAPARAARPCPSAGR